MLFFTLQKLLSIGCYIIIKMRKQAPNLEKQVFELNQVTYKIVKRLGAGGQATVWLAQKLDPQKQITIKMDIKSPKANSPNLSFSMIGIKVALKFYREQQTNLKSLEEEIYIIQILQKDQNPNLISVKPKLEKIQIKGSRYYFMQMEYCPEGTLEHHIYNGLIDRKVAFRYFSQVLNAVKSMHCRGIIHRDIKAVNILMKQSKDGYTVKLSDFGMSKVVGGSQALIKSYVGTISYMAIEVSKNQKYTLKADLWSLGVLLFRMLYKVYPFKSSPTVNQIEDAIRYGFQMPNQVAGRYEQQEHQLFKKIFTYEDSRLGFNGLLSLPIMKRYIPQDSIEHLLTDYSWIQKSNFNDLILNVAIAFKQSLDFELSRLNFIKRIKDKMKGATNGEAEISYAATAIGGKLAQELFQQVVFTLDNTDDIRGKIQSIIGSKYREKMSQKKLTQEMKYTKNQTADTMLTIIKDDKEALKMMDKIRMECVDVSKSISRSCQTKVSGDKQKEIDENPQEFLKKKLKESGLRPDKKVLIHILRLINQDNFIYQPKHLFSYNQDMLKKHNLRWSFNKIFEWVQHQTPDLLKVLESNLQKLA